MIKTIDTQELSQKLEPILTETAQQQHSFIIEKEGQQIVALVPYEIFLEWQAMLEDWQDWQAAEAVDKLWRKSPESFMSLTEFNDLLDEDEQHDNLSR